jgi:hypothetical protein
MRCTMTEDEIEALHRSLSRHDGRRKSNYSTDYEEEEEGEGGAPRTANNRVAPSFASPWGSRPSLTGYGEREPSTVAYPPRQFAQPQQPQQKTQDPEFGVY